MAKCGNLVKISNIKLKTMLAEHALFLKSGARAGTKFARPYSDLSGKNLCAANLGAADIKYSDLSNANLSHTTMIRTEASLTNMSNANLSNSNLEGCLLWMSKLDGAKICDCNMKDAWLQCANLHNANLSGSDLQAADLREANLTGADLSKTNLIDANLTGAILTDTKGLITQEEYLDKMLDKTENGYIVYKVFGLIYPPNKTWVIEAGSIINEPRYDMDRRVLYSSGINVATLDWIVLNRDIINSPIWKCLIRYDWMDDVCVPYATDGKIRCKKLELIDMC